MLPPLSFSSSSSAKSGDSSLTQGGSLFSASGAGDWNVNIAGAGPSIQASGASLLLLAAVLGAAWLLLKK